MSETKVQHTPGPWRFGGSSGAAVWAGEQFVAAVYGDDPSCKTDDRALANTALIAAAPDLLASLKEIVKSLADQDDEGLIEHAEPMIRARAAIAKATGSAA